MKAADDPAGEGPAPQPKSEVPRRAARRPVKLDGYALRADGTSVDIKLLDLTYEGCGVESPEVLQPAESLKLSVIGRGLIDAEVRWYKDGKAGLHFTSDMSETKEKIQRQAARANVTAEVKLRRIGQPNYTVRMFDLSPEGCRIEVIERPRVGERLMIKFEGLEVLQAEVCWTEGFIAGLEFDRPLHPAVFDLLVARLQ